jgi:hypothetical protein
MATKTVIGQCVYGRTAIERTARQDGIMACIYKDRLIQRKGHIVAYNRPVN